MSDPGSIARTEAGGFVLHYERRFDKPPSDVWAALTDPAILARWLARSEKPIDARYRAKYSEAAQ